MEKCVIYIGDKFPGIGNTAVGYTFVMQRNTQFHLGTVVRWERDVQVPIPEPCLLLYVV